MENTTQKRIVGDNGWNASCEGAWKVVLMADASAARRQELRQALYGLPLQVREAKSAREALAAARHGVDLVLMGLNLETDVTELCQKLKQISSAPFLPVFIMSPAESAEDEIRSMQAGADSYFAAPLRLRAFHARVQAVLRQKAHLDTKDQSETVLLSLAQSVEGRDPELGQHCERLALMASTLGLALGLPEQDIVTLRRAAYLHDIGKVSIADSVLFKSGPLTPEEWEVMKSHPERGERICGHLRSLAPILPIVRHHHEKWDGSGYPDALAGEEIPLLARILQLADIYDALTHERCYKRAFTPHEAQAMMRDEARKGWRDPQLTEQFVALIPLFSLAETPDFSGLSLSALAGGLREAHEQFCSEQPLTPGACNYIGESAKKTVNCI